VTVELGAKGFRPFFLLASAAALVRGLGPWLDPAGSLVDGRPG